MEESLKNLKHTVIDSGELGTLWRCHILANSVVALEYKDGPWLLTQFHVGIKIRVGSREERNGRNWYETPLVAKVLKIERLNPTEVRVTFNCLTGCMWALDVSPESVRSDPNLEAIAQAVDEHSLDTLFFLNKSYNNGELL